VLTKEEALRLFGSNPFKVSLITGKIPDGGKVTAYRCGTLIDLCTGPHIPSTKIIKAFKVMKTHLLTGLETLKMIVFKEFTVLRSHLRQKWTSTSNLERKQPREITEQLVKHKDSSTVINFLQVVHSCIQKVPIFTTDLWI